MKTTRWILLALAVFLFTRGEARAYSIYLTTENPIIQGEVTAKGYENSWRLVSFSQDIVTPIDQSGGPPTAGRAVFSDFAIAKFLDKASVLVLLNTAQGGPIGKVNIFLVNDTFASPYVAYKIVLENVLISSIKHDTGDISSTTPVGEEVKFNFTKITWTYTPVDPSTGKVGTPITRFWDLVKNAGG